MKGTIFNKKEEKVEEEEKEENNCVPIYTRDYAIYPGTTKIRKIVPVLMGS